MAAYIDPLDHLLAGNRHYVQRTTEKDPNTFSELAKGQAPEVLWIGCADSRVPETTVCNCKPGDIFVHRNIANTVHVNDLNSASVVEYAVAHLKVKKVVVCGHTKCGGAAAALGDADLGETLNGRIHCIALMSSKRTANIMLTWLHPVRELRRKHKTELEALHSDDARASRVAELNVQQSIEVLRHHPAIKKAISERGLTLHGMIYDIGAGELKMIGDASGKKPTGLWSPK